MQINLERLIAERVGKLRGIGIEVEVKEHERGSVWGTVRYTVKILNDREIQHSNNWMNKKETALWLEGALAVAKVKREARLRSTKPIG